MNLPGSLIHSRPKLEWSKVPFGTDCLSELRGSHYGTRAAGREGS